MSLFSARARQSEDMAASGDKGRSALTDFDCAHARISWRAAQDEEFG
jgi:hypothetical protein